VSVLSLFLADLFLKGGREDRLTWSRCILSTREFILKCNCGYMIDLYAQWNHWKQENTTYASDTLLI